MELTNLISAFETYINIKKLTGDLTNIRPEEISDPNSRVVRYSMAKCTQENKQKFDQAKQELEDTLNSYIDERVKTVIESMNNGNL
jgi:RPA family protein